MKHRWLGQPSRCRIKQRWRIQAYNINSSRLHTRTDLNSRYNIFSYHSALYTRAVALLKPRGPVPWADNKRSAPLFLRCLRDIAQTRSIEPGARRTRRGSNEPKEKGATARFNPGSCTFTEPPILLLYPLARTRPV